ncbi:MAG TPA: heavy metal translocating P-type ATPase metal-binding domain-containing protein [Bacteroidia bacterium]|jgi:Cu+-exporting ATPase|nr:heavy metal translocating P-type ATPase metal-binding domain-containing protein [Bacteroidia bacterium]
MNIQSKKVKTQIPTCYHCGEGCKTTIVHFDNHEFCCEGCKLVYDLLKENSLCTYYNLNSAPGISPDPSIYNGKYDYLDNEKVLKKLTRFATEKQTHITLYIPKIHCSSCIWLLENMHKLNNGVISSTVNFQRKEVSIIFDPEQIKLSQLTALLTHIGYEPLIHLDDLEDKKSTPVNRAQIIKIGIAGFCFGNIMMLSFPEYFSLGNFLEQPFLKQFFGYLNLLLALPVFFYSASEFFISAWKSIRYRYLNIDAPIALAIVTTFSRSVYEIVSAHGVGYLDSMSGIVFFMLIGRYFQNKTYETLSFERDYKSYFPVGVTIKQNNKERNIPVSDLKKGDHIIIRNNELIPSDAILISHSTHIDYSFISGESAPVKRNAGDFIYAGGKQLDGAIELKVVESTSQSYLTQLWNRDKKESSNIAQQTYIDNINKYFTIAVLVISTLSGVYWLYTDPGKSLNAFTAVLIVACPCGLLLTSTFANGNMLRILGRNKFYLKNAGVIQKLAKADTILLDKTGTITSGSVVNFIGPPLDKRTLALATSLASQSSHPLSRKIAELSENTGSYHVTDFEEIRGRGIKGYIGGTSVILGSEYFVTGRISTNKKMMTAVFLMIDGKVTGYFTFENAYRSGLKEMVNKLSGTYMLKLLSGDNDSERANLKSIFGSKTELLFNQKPEEKKNFVNAIQQNGYNVMMIGDGLNDAGALKQSNIGIAVSDDTNTFSPACDAIVDGSVFTKLPDFIYLAKATKGVIVATFVISLTYNLIGLSFAVQGSLSPVIAAILMPVSSVTIVLLATLSTSLIAKAKRL